MLRILIAWELGANLGHLLKLVCVARQLRLRGHQIIFAVKDVIAAQQILKADGFACLQAPMVQSHPKLRREAASYADILTEAGLADYQVLSGLIGAWQSLLALSGADVLLAQHAPVAQLAARMNGTPCLALNTGFECPPAVSPFPCFRPWLQLGREELMATEAVLLDNVNTLFASSGISTQSSLHRAVAADVSLLATIPELDHYPIRRGGQYVGPLFLASEGVEWRWPETSATRCIFVYLRPFSGLVDVLGALSEMQASVVAFIPGIDECLRGRFAERGIDFSVDRLKISGLLPGMDLAITHASHGTVAATLLAGVPQLSIPTTIEQWMLCRRLEQSGLGIGVKGSDVSTRFRSVLIQILTTPSYQDTAQKFARKYARYDQDEVTTRIASSIERLPQYVLTTKRKK